MISVSRAIDYPGVSVKATTMMTKVVHNTTRLNILWLHSVFHSMMSPTGAQNNDSSQGLEPGPLDEEKSLSI